jgi:hypothetical protein
MRAAGVWSVNLRTLSTYSCCFFSPPRAVEDPRRQVVPGANLQTHLPGQVRRAQGVRVPGTGVALDVDHPRAYFGADRVILRRVGIHLRGGNPRATTTSPTASAQASFSSCSSRQTERRNVSADNVPSWIGGIAERASGVQSESRAETDSLARGGTMPRRPRTSPLSREDHS